MVQKLTSKIVVDGLIYPEGIRWHAGKVWFSDILDFKVYAYDPKTGKAEVVTTTTDRPSGLGFLPDGRLLIATMGERTLLRLDPDGLKVAADLSPLCAGMNDMVVDPQGRAYMDAHFADGTSGLILVEPNGDHRIVVTGMKMSNGLAVTADGATLIADDLWGCQILAFDIRSNGDLMNRRVFADLGEGVFPDGCCLDAEGAVWVGQPMHGRLRRILEGGEVTHEIDYGKKWGIAPVLGGPDRRDLYICTADVDLEKILELMADPTHARGQCRGWIEVVEGVGIAGAGTP